MAWKKKSEEKLLSFSPKKKQNDEEDDFDWDFPLEEEEEVEEEAPAVEEVVEEPEVVEEEVAEEEVEEETYEEADIEDEAIDEPVDEIEEVVDEVEIDDVESEDFVEEVEEVEEVDLDSVDAEEYEEEEVVEEVDLDDIEAEDYAEEAEIDEVLAEDYEEEEAIEEDVEEVEEFVPVADLEEDVDRTNIFEHAVTYYDQNTIILPRNFESRIRMASDDVKKLYSDIKNVLMEYSGVKSRMLKYVEVFRCGGVVAKLRIKGKSLYLYLRLDPSCVDHDYLKIVDKSMRRGYEETPAEIKVTGKRKCKRSIEMIRLMMDALGVGHRRHPEVVDYVEKYPTPDNAVIFGKNMVKVSRRSDYEK